MAQASKLVPFIKSWEGDFVNDPDDLGGATNKGITLATYGAYCRRKGYPKPTVARLKAMDDATWYEIFKTMYWDRWKADNIVSQSVANIVVDWVWASGSYGVTRVQKLLGVSADGIVGSKTLAALNSQSPLPLFGKIKQDRIKFIDEICAKRPANNKFKKGWMNRINAITFES